MDLKDSKRVIAEDDEEQMLSGKIIITFSATFRKHRWITGKAGINFYSNIHNE